MIWVLWWKVIHKNSDWAEPKESAAASPLDKKERYSTNQKNVGGYKNKSDTNKNTFVKLLLDSAYLMPVYGTNERYLYFLGLRRWNIELTTPREYVAMHAYYL